MSMTSQLVWRTRPERICSGCFIEHSPYSLLIAQANCYYREEPWRNTIREDSGRIRAVVALVLVNPSTRLHGGDSWRKWGLMRISKAFSNSDIGQISKRG